jgi:hypothetical protein
MSEIEFPDESEPFDDAQIEAINQELALFSMEQRAPIRGFLWDAATLAVKEGMSDQAYVY